MVESAIGFSCERCHRFHPVLPLSYSVKAPLAVTRIPPTEIDQRLVINKDQCVIDGTQFFLRGRIVIPIHELEEPFIWGVWAEVSPKNFIHTQATWVTPGRESTPAFPGWLDTELPLYGETRNLALTIHTQVVGRRPHFQVVPAQHPLALEQIAGIPLARVQQIAASFCTALEPIAKTSETYQQS